MESLSKIHRVPLKWEGEQYFCVVIDNVFTQKECQELKDRAEKQGFEPALVNMGGGHQVKLTNVRNSDRCIIDDPTVAQNLWLRIMETLGTVQAMDKATDVDSLQLKKLYTPQKGWTAVGLNERLRILKYDGPGTYFRPHYDGSYERGLETGQARQGEQSFVTCQLYLNQDCDGGETRFLSPFNDQEGYKVSPKTGSVLLFQHDLLHEGCPVSRGEKYVVRTDVMCTNRGPGHEYSGEPIILTTNNNASFEAMQED